MSPALTLPQTRDGSIPCGPSGRGVRSTVASERPGAPQPLPRDPAAPSVGTVVPGAVSSLEPSVTDPRTLMSLGASCRRAAIAFAIQADQLGRSALAENRPYPDEAVEAAQRAFDLEHVAQLLQDDSQDVALQDFRRHRATGGDFVRVPTPVVVGEERQSTPSANMNWSWLPRPVRAAAALLPFRRRKAA